MPQNSAESLVSFCRERERDQQFWPSMCILLNAYEEQSKVDDLLFPAHSKIYNNKTQINKTQITVYDIFSVQTYF